MCKRAHCSILQLHDAYSALNECFVILTSLRGDDQLYQLPPKEGLKRLRRASKLIKRAIRALENDGPAE